jgi:phage gp36-like protein
MFIEKADIQSYILADELYEITRGDDVVVNAAISAACQECRGYLYDAFDVNAIFAKTGRSRDNLLIQLIADMAIWKIVAACQAGINHADRLARYEQAVKYLRMVAKTEIYADLPRRTLNETAEHKILFDSNPKRGNYY